MYYKVSVVVWHSFTFITAVEATPKMHVNQLNQLSSSSFSSQVKFGKAKSYFLGHRFMVTYGRDPGTGQAFEI